MADDIQTENAHKPYLTTVWYDRIRFIVQVFLPAFATLYFALGSTWNLPNVEQTIGSLAAITTFLGVLLKASRSNYEASDAKYDGELVMSINENGDLLHTLQLNSDPSQIDQKKAISFKVVPLPE